MSTEELYSELFKKVFETYTYILTKKEWVDKEFTKKNYPLSSTNAEEKPSLQGESAL